MNAKSSLIEQLESAFAGPGTGRRAEMLRRMTDLFAAGSASFSTEQVELFDDVMGRLLAEIDGAARAAFGQQLADLPVAPPNLVRSLALDDSIDVASPILARYQRLDDEILVESARTKSQAHLLAISQRASLAEPVTDILLDRGNQQVALSTADNCGAKFSEFGYSTLVKRSEHDHDLARKVWTRSDIPRQHLLNLYASASENVRLSLEKLDHRKAKLIREVIARASYQIQAASREQSKTYQAALSLVRELHQSGTLSEANLWKFAAEGKFDEAAIAMSLMCGVSIGLVERAITCPQPDQVIVLTKSIGLSWDTTKLLLQLRADTGDSNPQDLVDSQSNFNMLQPVTAKKTLQFYQLRERAGAAPNLESDQSGHRSSDTVH
jgi:uncharacterized protein (DUF2336 family)